MEITKCLAVVCSLQPFFALFCQGDKKDDSKIIIWSSFICLFKPKIKRFINNFLLPVIDFMLQFSRVLDLKLLTLLFNP